MSTLLCIALAFALAVCPFLAHATTIKVDFTGGLLDGPLAGEEFTGWFTYDTAGNPEGQTDRPASFQVAAYVDTRPASLFVHGASLHVGAGDFFAAPPAWTTSFVFPLEALGLTEITLSDFLPTSLIERSGHGGSAVQLSADPASRSTNPLYQNYGFSQTVVPEDYGVVSPSRSVDPSGVTVVPEPSTTLLLVSGGLLLWRIRRRPHPPHDV